MRKIEILAALLLACSAAAQQPLGVLHNVPASFTSRGGSAPANSNPVVVFDRIDKEMYTGWGFAATSPNMRAIAGLHFTVQDEDLSTPDAFGIVVYTEDPTNPDYPFVSAPIGSLGGLLIPGGTGPGSYDAIASFATPMLAPGSGDVFCGLALGVAAAAAWPTDGLSVWALSSNGAYAEADQPGAGIGSSPPSDTFGGYYAAALPLLAYASTRQFFVEPVSATPGGVAGAITNQASNLPSQTAPGTFSQFSGQFPDARSPARNPGRMDDVSHRFSMPTLPDFTPVVFLIDLGRFSSTELPMGLLLPGSTGVACLNLGRFRTNGIGLTIAGEAWQTFSIPAASRALIAGLPLLRQAAAFDVATSSLIAGACARQVF